MAEADQDHLLGQSVGERLRLAREAKGLSLDDVARQTRIPVRHLEHIEREEWDALPAITYSVGFARSYANVVELDGAKVGAEVRQQLGGARPGSPAAAPFYEPADPARVPPRSIAIAAAVIAVLLVIGYLVWRSSAVDDDSPADQVRAALHEAGALPQQLRPPAGDLAAELAQRPERGRAAGAVGGQAVVALEGAQPHLGLGTEDAVDRAGVVAELVQAVLQVGHVVPAHGAHRVVVQQPVAERPAGLGQGAVGLLADAAVDGEPAHLLEVTDGELGGGVVERLVQRRRLLHGPRCRQQRQGAQGGVHVGHGGAAVAGAQGLHVAVGSHRGRLWSPGVCPARWAPGRTRASPAGGGRGPASGGPSAGSRRERGDVLVVLSQM